MWTSYECETCEDEHVGVFWKISFNMQLVLHGQPLFTLFVIVQYCNMHKKYNLGVFPQQSGE